MSIYSAQLCNTFDALMFRMFSEQIRLQVLPKLFGVNSWIAQMIRQWIPDCWSGDRKCRCKNSRWQTVNVMLWRCSRLSVILWERAVCFVVLCVAELFRVWSSDVTTSHAGVTCALCCRTFPSVVLLLHNITDLCDACFMLHHMLVRHALYVAELSRVWSSDVTTLHAFVTCALLLLLLYY